MKSKKIIMAIVVGILLVSISLGYAASFGKCRNYGCRCAFYQGKSSAYDSVCICGHYKTQHTRIR